MNHPSATFVDRQGTERRAAIPHCDENVLHAPGECVHCDKYPDAQAARGASGVNFTGHHDTGKQVCPSEQRRSLQTIEAWPGNRPNGSLVPSAAEAARHPDRRGARLEFITDAAHGQPEVSPEGVGLNMPAIIHQSTLATRTDERDELGAAVSAIASQVCGREVDTKAIEIAISMILEAIGEDLSAPDLRDTPARVARFWRDFIGYDPGNTNTTFENELVTDQMVVVSGMRIWSLCAHHLLPFVTEVSCGYIAENKVLGLSKFARIAHQAGHRLQTQEAMAVQIADEISRITGSHNVAVYCAHGLHTCMSMRGIKTAGSMSNAEMRGVFRTDASARAEFYNQATNPRR